MDTEPKGRFWIGPVISAAQARRIIAVTGWLFVAMGVVVLLTSLPLVRAGGRSLGAALGVSLLFSVPAGFLLAMKSRAAAIVLIAMSAISVLGGLSFAAKYLADRPAMAVGGLIGVLFWAILGALAWRAFRAAAALRRLAGTAEAVRTFD